MAIKDEGVKVCERLDATRQGVQRIYFELRRIIRVLDEDGFSAGDSLKEALKILGEVLDNDL